MAKDKFRVKWEIFKDDSFYGLFCVRPIGDTNFNSPRSFHFVLAEDAAEFKRLLDISQHAVSA